MTATLRIDRAALDRAVRITASAVAAKSSVPILAGVHVVAQDNGAIFTGFDHDSLAVATIDCDAPKRVEFVVSHRLLGQVVSVAPSGVLDLAVGKGGVTITAKRAEWKLPVMSAADWPRVPEIGSQVAELPAGEFAEAVERVAVAATETKPEARMHVVEIASRDGVLSLAATDSHRVHSAAPGFAELAADWCALVPAKRLAAIADRLGEDGSVTLHHDGNLFGVRTEAATLAVRLADGSSGWVKWSPLIDAAERNVKATVILDRDELVQAVKQVSGFSPTEGGGFVRIVLTVTEDEITFSGGDAASGSGQAAIEAKNDGPAFRAMVNAPFLIDAVSRVRSGTARMLVADPLKQIGIAGADEPVEFVVMPLRHESSEWLT